MFSDKILQNHRQNRKLTTLVEQRTTYNADYSELNIFETHKVASQVSLTFDFPVIASMITGKNICIWKECPLLIFYQVNLL